MVVADRVREDRWMVGRGGRAFLLASTFVMCGCATFASEPHQPSAAPTSPAIRPTAHPTSIAQPTPTTDPAAISGPPFPAPQPGVTLVDQADVFSEATEELASQRMAEIESQLDATVVVYTQYKPGSDERSTKQDAKALKLKWRLAMGLVVMWNTTSEECVAGNDGNGQIQLYADTRFAATRLSDLKRQKIFDDVMLPLLRECREDDALLAALDAISTEIRAPKPTDDSATAPNSNDACSDDAFKIYGWRWDRPFKWSFEEESVPEDYDSDEVLDVLIRSATNVTSGSNDCGLPDKIDATATYAGMTTKTPCVPDEEDGSNTVGFGELPDYLGEDTLAFVCTFDERRTITEADMVINSAMPWALSQQECYGWGELLEATVTHEFGHVFGLGHVSERLHGDLTMSPTSNGPCDAAEISLGLGDILGLEELY